MAHARTSTPNLLAGLAQVFRTRGYDGASLGELAQAAGLEKASLYHRFPGGKEQMVQDVVASVDQWFEANVFAALKRPGPPRQKAHAVTLALKAFYADGRQPCTLDTLSIPSAAPALAAQVERSATRLLHALAALSREAGFPAAHARRNAQRAIVLLEGSLVYARALGDTAPFRAFIAELPELLTGSAGENGQAKAQESRLDRTRKLHG